MSHFSDSVIVSIHSRKLVPKQLKFIIEILVKFIEYNLVARGAIAYGELVHDSKNIYGPALIKVVELEKLAIYPRILLDESLHEAILPTIGNATINYIDFFRGFRYVKRDEEEYECKNYIDLLGEINRMENSENILKTLDKIIAKGLDSNDYKIYKNMNGYSKKEQIINRIKAPSIRRRFVILMR